MAEQKLQAADIDLVRKVLRKQIADIGTTFSTTYTVTDKYGVPSERAKNANSVARELVNSKKLIKSLVSDLMALEDGTYFTSKEQDVDDILNED